MTLARTHKLMRNFWEGTPAFHAGFLVVIAIFASLCNVGILFLLLLARWLVDTSERSIAGMPLSRAMFRALRPTLVDVSLLLFSLCAEILIPFHPLFIGENGFLLALWTVSLSALLVVPKFLVLIRSFAQIFSGVQSFAHERRDLSYSEAIAIFIIVVELVLLFLSPQLTVGRWAHLLTNVRQSLAPWRW